MKGGIRLCVFTKTLKKGVMFFRGGTASNLEGAMPDRLKRKRL